MSFGSGVNLDQVEQDAALAQLVQLEEHHAARRGEGEKEGLSSSGATGGVVRGQLGGSGVGNYSPASSLVGSNGPPLSGSKMGPPAPGMKGAWAGGNVVVHNVVTNIVNCCNLGSKGWLRVFAAITLIVAVALVAFLGCYSGGLFHFEKFIGPIGSSVSLGGAGALVVLSGMVLFLSFRK